MPIKLNVKIVKIGNSLRMTIPKPVARALNWKEGDKLEVGITNGTMIVDRIQEI